ncbi:MAG: AbgT family transporter [Acidobacteriota bacterium]
MARFRVPHTLVLLLAINALALLLTWILPQGEFQRAENAKGKEVVVAGSYTSVEADRPGFESLFLAIPKGLDEARDIIFFLFIIGGAFAILRATGAVDASIATLLRVLSDRPSWLVAGGIFVFAVGSSTIGMSEEYLPFVPILLALAIGLGFDAVTAIGILCVGYGVGYGAAVINPFTVLIAQEVAGLELTSGWGYRLVMTAAFVALGIHHVWSYARRVREDPSSSLVADIEPDPAWTADLERRFTVAHGVIVGLLVIALGVIVYGINAYGWYILELSAIFFALGIAWAIVGRLSADTAAVNFCNGAAELTTTALLVGFARSILVILDEGRVTDTIVHAIAQPLQMLGGTFAAIGMFFFQSLCNVFIPSGSGQAYVTMPIMAPLSDLVGVNRQVAVLAFQMGDGLTNILVPTSAVLIGILTMARIPYERWLRFILPFMFKAWALGSLLIAIAVWIDYS